VSAHEREARAALAAADAAARREAVRRFEGCTALEAGAGTGKTTVLVSRVVAWCLGPGFERAEKEEGGPERAARRVLGGVVAITFTEAAAAEMAHRIGEALRALGRGERPIGLDDGDVPERELAAVRARSLVAELDQLVVQSIHAFCRRLLARHPL
jgi:ATP-dependent exoDNAse (exonuclease V) beta subunit